MQLNSQQILDQFHRATILTLKNLCQTEVTLTATFMKGSKPPYRFEVAGMIGLTSETARGSVGIYFSYKVFLSLLSRLFQETQTQITRNNEDAAAEILNIIFGSAKAELNKTGHQLQFSIPQVIRGGNVSTQNGSAQEVIISTFNSDLGEFQLEFTLLPAQSSSRNPENSKPMTAAEKAAFFKPFVNATIETFQQMCQIKCIARQPFSKKMEKAQFVDLSFDLAGFIGITSDQISASYLLSFKKIVFLQVMSRMLGESFKEITPGMEDGVAELLNIILGHAKAILNDQYGHTIQMALPTLLYGEAIHTSVDPEKTVLVIPFDSEVGPFGVEITIN
ncbi:MAG: chemotaxis protein CheX [Bdellovibrionia bacterium]